MNFNTLSKQIYDANRKIGWWDNPNECLFQKLQLVSTEIAEATEGERKNLMDDHLPHRKMGEVELADALIRTLDLGGRMKLKYDENQVFRASWIRRDYTVGRQHLLINMAISKMGEVAYLENEFIKTTNLEAAYTTLINAICNVSENLSYDLEGAMEDKLAYNAQRLDHKRENREKENGKKF